MAALSLFALRLTRQPLGLYLQYPHSKENAQRAIYAYCANHSPASLRSPRPDLPARARPSSHPETAARLTPANRTTPRQAPIERRPGPSQLPSRANHQLHRPIVAHSRRRALNRSQLMQTLSYLHRRHLRPALHWAHPNLTARPNP